MPTTELWVVFATCVTAVCVITFFAVIYQINKLGVIMGAVQDAVDAVSAQLGKAKGEIVAQIEALEAQVAAGETPNLDALKAAAQALDDVVADAPVEQPPVEEPPVEAPVEDQPV